MHELSLCRSIYRIVDRARDGRPVLTVYVQVGQLRQVVPATLDHCWGLVTQGSPLDGACLVIDHVPVLLDCRACGRRTTVEQEVVLTCAGCGSGDVAMLTGEEFMVTSLDLVVRPTPAKEP